MQRSSLAAVLATVLLAAPAVQAQQQDWSFTATGYLWLPTTDVTVDTPRGSLSAELSVKDALEALDFAAMGNFEARRGKLGLLADLLYFNLSQSQDTPFGALFSEGVVNTRITSVTLAAFYRVHEAAGVAIDLGAGLRAIDNQLTITLVGDSVPSETRTQDDSWIDPVIAVRARADLGGQWFGSAYMDYGGTDDGHSGQAGLGVGYQINDRLSVEGGWRYLEIERTAAGNTLDLRQSGTILGLSWQF